MRRVGGYGIHVERGWGWLVALLLLLLLLLRCCLRTGGKGGWRLESGGVYCGGEVAEPHP